MPAEPQPAVIAWDLSHVLPATEGPALESLIADLEEKVKRLEAARPSLDTLADPVEVARLYDLDAEIGELASRLASHGELAFAADTTDAKAKSLMARMDDLTTDVGNRIRFLDLWWKAIPDERAAALLPRDHPEVAHYLQHLRLFREHTLSEAEERVVSVKDVTGSVALDRLREILTSAFRFKDPVTGDLVNQSELSRRVYEPDAAVREGAYRELWRVYGEQENALSFLYQTVVQDWANEHLKLRKYPTPIGVRNKANEIPDEAVETLLRVCSDNREVFQRYFQTKAKRLGIPASRFHVYAPLETEKMKIGYGEAREKVLSVFDAFSPDVGREARRVFDENHVHVYPAPNKRGGAFCATVNTRMTPYVFLNFTGDAQSVKTLAHEMGHAVHSLLARNRHPLVSHATLPMCETASVFAEMLLHGELMKEADERQRVSLLSDKLGEIYATVMRQAYFTKFEIQAHDLVRQGAQADDLNEAYLANLREQFGPVDVPEEFRREWTYIPHIYASPFYCYAYSFGMLLSLALYATYREQGESFVPKYTELLATGGSASPETMLAKLDVDVKDRAFWQKGFDVIGEMAREFEKVA